MPTPPLLPTDVSDGEPGHVAHANIVHRVVNGVYKAVIADTLSTDHRLTPSNSGEVLPVNSSSAVVITAPPLESGSTIEVLRLGAGAVTIRAVGVASIVPDESFAGARARGSSISLLWLTETSVLAGGDLV